MDSPPHGSASIVSALQLGYVELVCIIMLAVVGFGRHEGEGVVVDNVGTDDAPLSSSSDAIPTSLAIISSLESPLHDSTSIASRERVVVVAAIDNVLVGVLGSEE